MIVLKSGSFAAVVFLCSWCTDYPLSNRSHTRCTITRSYARALVTMPLALPVHLMSLIFHQLFDLGREPKDVAQEHGVTPRAVRRWKQNWRLSGTPRAPKGGCKTGRPRVCTPMQEESLLHHINEDPSIYLDEMAWYLFDCFGVKPCIATVFNILTRNKWSRKRPPNWQHSVMTSSVRVGWQKGYTGVLSSWFSLMRQRRASVLVIANMVGVLLAILALLTSTSIAR
jgi:transposase